MSRDIPHTRSVVVAHGVMARKVAPVDHRRDPRRPPPAGHSHTYQPATSLVAPGQPECQGCPVTRVSDMSRDMTRVAGPAMAASWRLLPGKQRGGPLARPASSKLLL